MADKSCYAGVGGYGSGYAPTASNTGYAREDYASGGSSSGGSSGGGGGASGGNAGVFKARTDQSCYLGP